VSFDGNHVADDRLGLSDAHFSSHSAGRLILRYVCIGRVGLPQPAAPFRRRGWFGTRLRPCGCGGVGGCWEL